MRSLAFDGDGTAPLEIVCIGAHADDLEIGCGGTVRQLVERHPGSRVRWWVVTGDAARDREARDAAEHLLGDACMLEVTVCRFRDGFLPAEFGGVKAAFEEFRHGAEPDVVFTHARDDRHQDHRTVSDLTWNTWRDHLVLEYEIPKWDGDLGRPNLYVPLSETTVQRKLDVLSHCFPSQRSKSWFDESTFRGLLRLRGLECRAEGGLAEAFHARKMTVGL